MGTANPSPLPREPQLTGQTVVVIGGSAGVGLETARLAGASGAKLVLVARNAERLQQVAGELAAMTTAAFDATDANRLKQFFADLPSPIDHVLVTGRKSQRTPQTKSGRAGLCCLWAARVGGARRRDSL